MALSHAPPGPVMWHPCSHAESSRRPPGATNVPITTGTEYSCIHLLSTPDKPPHRRPPNVGTQLLVISYLPLQLNPVRVLRQSSTGSRNLSTFFLYVRFRAPSFQHKSRGQVSSMLRIHKGAIRTPSSDAASEATPDPSAPSSDAFPSLFARSGSASRLSRRFECKSVPRACLCRI